MTPSVEPRGKSQNKERISRGHSVATVTETIKTALWPSVVSVQLDQLVKILEAKHCSPALMLGEANCENVESTFLD